MKAKQFIRSVAITCLALFILSSSASASIGEFWRKWRAKKKYHRTVVHHHRRHHKPVNAPLDGGLVTALAVAGVTYFIIRKKKK